MSPESIPSTASSATAESDRASVDRDAVAHLEATLAYARERDYTGWDLYDGESSRILRSLPVENEYVNLAVQQVVRRSPVNLRPLLAVEQRRNFMGAALFALANVAAADLTGDDAYEDEARDLVEWLVENRSEGYSGFCGGHKHPLQGLRTRTMPNTPGVVGTAWAVRALLVAGERLDPEYADVARTAADFVVEDLDFTENRHGARIKYKPSDPGDSVTLNANAIGARLLLDLYDAFDDPEYRERAEAILDYVAARQTDLGGWHYRDPPGDSHLSMDNFHNGFVIECFDHHGAVTGSDRYEATVERALDFYRSVLFDANGAPNHDESSAYPKDIHDVSQGVIVFDRVGDRAFADRILQWGLANLSDGDGAFYHQRRRWFTDRTTLMRWCQAWMAYALAVHATTSADADADRPAAASLEGRYSP